MDILNNGRAPTAHRLFLPHVVGSHNRCRKQHHPSKVCDEKRNIQVSGVPSISEHNLEENMEHAIQQMLPEIHFLREFKKFH